MRSSKIRIATPYVLITDRNLFNRDLKTEMLMNIEATKLELMQLLLNTKKLSTLLKVKRIYEEESFDWRDEMSIDEQQEIEDGLRQVQTGEVKAHETVMKRFATWK